jgi:hypothetical protein
MHVSQEEHRGMSPEITAGDVDVDVEIGRASCRERV